MNKLTVLTSHNERVLTTKQLAEVYETSENNIKNNFNNNKDRFIEGKHYYKLVGDELKQFILQVNDIDLQISKMTRCLYLWTEKGASRMCKILDTDKAWEQFDVLEETYFNVKDNKRFVIGEEKLMKIISEQKIVIEEQGKLLSKFTRLTEEAKLLYKPSHKRKLQYDRLIKSCTTCKEDYLTVKEWVFALLELDKWEDASIQDHKKIIAIIKTASVMQNMKSFEQLSLL